MNNITRWRVKLAYSSFCSSFCPSVCDLILCREKISLQQLYFKNWSLAFSPAPISLLKLVRPDCIKNRPLWAQHPVYKALSKKSEKSYRCTIPETMQLLLFLRKQRAEIWAKRKISIFTLLIFSDLHKFQTRWVRRNLTLKHQTSASTEK